MFNCLNFLLQYWYLFLLQYRYQVLSEGKRSRVKGSDLALMEHCSDAQGIAVGSRIVGECLIYNKCCWILYTGVRIN